MIVALWVILILSLLIGTFAYDMHIEARITSYYRKRLKAEYLARAGVEWAFLMMAKSADAKPEEGAEEIPADEKDYGGVPEALALGSAVNHVLDFDAGSVAVTIYPAESRRNVNKLSEEDWDLILEQAGVPQELWDEMIDAFYDWTDENDLKRDPTNETEKDARFYKDRDYEPKNAPLDTVDELLMVKGFGPAVVYGGVLDEDAEISVRGIAEVLTAWGDGRVNPNAANTRTLMSLGLEDYQVEALIQYRAGDDGVDGTADDQPFEGVDEVIDIGGISEDLRAKLVIKEAQFQRVVSIATVGNQQPVQRAITCILRRDEEKVTPVYWIEEHTL